MLKPLDETSADGKAKLFAAGHIKVLQKESAPGSQQTKSWLSIFSTACLSLLKEDGSPR